MATPSDKALCLLSLDGGGVRGLASLLILQRIMYVLNERVGPEVKRPLLPCQYFDLMAGTSTGGLIAIILGVLRMDVDECIDKYLAMAPQIFPKEGFFSGSTLGKIFHGFRGAARFDPASLESVVKALVTEKLETGQDTPFENPERAKKSAECRTFVCVTNKATGKAFRLRSYHSSREPSTGCTIWQAARATSAAPLYFPPIELGHPPRIYVDGGLTYNNPVRALYDEAKQVWGKSSRKFGCIISIGTGVPALKSTGNTGKEIVESLTHIAVDTQKTADEFVKEIGSLSKSDGIAYFRFNVEQGLQDVKLEEWASFETLCGATDYYLSTRDSDIDRCVNSILDLSEVSTAIQEDLSPVISELPITGEEFFGRASEMEQLCRVFHTNNESGQKAVVIWGFGGLGKSRLALQYIKIYQSRYSAVLWIDAVTFERAIESFSQAASNIRSRDPSIPQPTGDKKDIAIVHHWLLRIQAKNDWLLVIDSVDDEKLEFRGFIPQCPCGKIIITSTLSRVAKHLDCHGIELGSIDNAAGAGMLMFRLSPSYGFDIRTNLAGSIVKSLDGVPLAIEQARALIQDGIPIRDFLGFFKAHYQQLMAPKPERSAWYYDKNRSIVTMLNMAIATVKEDDDAAHLLSLFSCFGPHTVAVNLLSQSWNSENTIEDSGCLENSNLSTKIQWLKAMGQNSLTLRLAISRLENLCFIKTIRNDEGGVTSASVHGAICKWRLEAVNEHDREDYIILAALVISQKLPDIGIDAVPNFQYIPLIKKSHDLMQQYIEPSGLEAPNGRLCRQYAMISARYAQLYSHSQYANEAEAMFASVTTYESLRQGSSWPQDRRSLLIMKGLAKALWKSKKFDQTAEVLESLYRESARLLGDIDDISVWTAARLREVRERQVMYDQYLQRAVIASDGTKTPLRLEQVSQGEEFQVAAEEHARPISDEEYRLVQMVQESQEQFGPNDHDTRQAGLNLACFYEKSELYLQAGETYEKLWEAYKNLWHAHSSYMYVNQGYQALESAVNCYIQSHRLAERIELGFLGDGLIWAVFKGDEELATTLIQAGAKVNHQDNAGNTALHHAAIECREALVHRLLSADADNKICNAFENTPLHLLFSRLNPAVPEDAKGRLIRIAGMLVGNGAEIDAVTNNGQSVLYMAVLTGVTAYIQFLLENGVRCDGWGTGFRSALQLASKSGSENIVKLLLESRIYERGESKLFIAALVSAAQKGRSAIVRLLLTKKAFLYGSVGRLSRAFAVQDRQIIQMLFEALIDVDTPEDSSRHSEREIAVQAVLCAIIHDGDVYLLQELCKRQIDINQSTYPISFEATLLHNAACLGHEKVVEILLKSSADADKLDDFGMSPLFLAVDNDHYRIVEMLLPVTKNINAQATEGETALSRAAYLGNRRTIEMLLNAGAQIAPLEPGPHSKLVPVSERVSGYACDAMWVIYYDPVLSNEDRSWILKSMLLAEIALTSQSASKTAFDRVTSIYKNKFSANQKALNILDKEGLDGLEPWFHSRYRRTSQLTPSIRALEEKLKDLGRRRVRDLEESLASDPIDSLHIFIDHPLLRNFDCKFNQG